MNFFAIDSSNQLTLSSADIHHIISVLRARAGDIINVVEPKTQSLNECQITNVSKNNIEFKVISKTPITTEPPAKIVLFQCIPKSQKMELIIPPCVELGVSKIVPVVSKFVVPNASFAAKKQERWQTIAEASAKQSRRGIIPRITQPITFEQAIEQLKPMDICLMPYENPTESSEKIDQVMAKQNIQNIKSIGILIGSEGGFAPQEADLALANDVNIVTLGSRILRTQTAGAVAITLVMSALGEM
ncbi:MAG: 16S rRNA (uracil(1498)-N(3))-methyltransferase [Clostridiales bacterium]|jgi:16S rRNA (uracil1498-N3)-methyltransferase|nr:16S rRNA (uracil(1498)-N(3))-methyltransferase [Clostridiales bacterium]